MEYSRRDDLESCAYILLFLNDEMNWKNNNDEKEENIEDIYFKKNDIIKKNIQENIKEMIVYCRNLEFNEEPNYNNLINILTII